MTQPIPIDALDRREAVALLLRRTPDQDQVSASQMAEQLGPAVGAEQAAAYLE